VTRRDDIDSRRIVVFGRSIGTALAVHLAAERPAVGAVLVSPFDSLTAIGKKHYPWLPVSLLLRHRFETLADAKRNRMPMLTIVGDSDGIIPPERSRALFDVWGGPKTWLAIPGADHNELGGEENFWKGVMEFLSER
jgi:pimeloyl-ACP methyl ester carboxylesterase